MKEEDEPQRHGDAERRKAEDCRRIGCGAEDDRLRPEKSRSTNQAACSWLLPLGAAVFQRLCGSISSRPLSIIFRSAFDVPLVHDGLQDSFDIGQQDGIEGFGGPGGPVANVVGIGRAYDAGTDVRIVNRELHGQFGDIDATRLAQLSRLPAGQLDRFRSAALGSSRAAKGAAFMMPTPLDSK